MVLNKVDVLYTGIWFKEREKKDKANLEEINKPGLLYTEITTVNMFVRGRGWKGGGHIINVVYSV